MKRTIWKKSEKRNEIFSLMMLEYNENIAMYVYIHVFISQQYCFQRRENKLNFHDTCVFGTTQYKRASYKTLFVFIIEKKELQTSSHIANISQLPFLKLKRNLVKQSFITLKPLKSVSCEGNINWIEFSVLLFNRNGYNFKPG